MREEGAEFGSALRVDAGDKGDATGEMRAKGGVGFAVLRVGSETNAVDEDRFQAVVVGADDIGVAVDDDACEKLADALAHDARLAVMRGETLFLKNRGNTSCEARDAAFEFLVAGKSKVVGVAGVGGACRSGESARRQSGCQKQRLARAGDVGAP